MSRCAKKRNPLATWISLVAKSGILEMKRAAKTFKANRKGILNGCQTNKTNATGEGLNNSTKMPKRTNYGFRAFKRMRRSCLLPFGYCCIVKHGIKIYRVKTELP